MTTTRAPERPWYAALDLAASHRAPAAARRWIDACMEAGAVPAEHRGGLRRLGSEFAREAAQNAGTGDPLRLELDLVGPLARLSVTGPAPTARLGARAVEVLRSADEWGVENVPGPRRLVWCHVRIAA